MSTIGGGANFGPLVGSTAGLSGQRKVSETDQNQTEAADRKFQLDRQAAAEKALGDIGASDQTDERDADGRQPWAILRRRKSDGQSPDTPQPRTPDPDHERGGALDLDA